ncbi:MAG: metallophosphoesterase family protein [Candidatus Hydrogenedentes bacterium]|nr:metallophosphoesterase family protein [Candidatus Hydrogenedentota bacterium]
MRELERRGTAVKIGVISDTHGNLKLMFRAVGVLTNELDVELFYHVGDNYDDAEALAHAGHAVRMVPGLWCPEYHNTRVPNRIAESIDGITVVAVHAEKDLRGADWGASIILTGHTHVARVDKLGRTLHVNPGHLKSMFDRGERPSFATIETSDKEVRVKVHELSGDVRIDVRVPREELA